MRTHRIGPHATLSDLKPWTGEDQHLRLRISRRSRFGPFTEAAAIAILNQLSRSGIRISASCDFALSETDFKEPFEAKLGVLCTLFGFCLQNVSASIKDANSEEILEPLASQLWSHVLAHKGFVGDGKYGCIVCRDPDVPLPPALRSPPSGRKRKFPYRDTFSRLLGSTAAEMGIASSIEISSHEKKLVTFLYEAARNAHEHARTDVHYKAISGIRGIVIEKIRMESQSAIKARTGLPVIVADYLRRIYSSSTGSSVAITVLDSGPGIHHRLPGREGETELERLKRAFEAGESSKPKGMEHRGLGLTNIIGAFSKQKQVSPFLFVRSADLAVYCDFSSETPDHSARLVHLPEEVPSACGTALTLIWPITQENPDQMGLEFTED